MSRSDITSAPRTWPKSFKGWPALWLENFDKLSSMITLVRHAESVANVGQRTSDPSGICLTDAGMRQAEALAQAWDGAPSRVLSSPFQRAIDTAIPLAARFGLPVEAAPVQEFTYLSPSRCAGTSARERRPWVDNYWRNAKPSHRDGVGAETFHEFATRVQAAMRDIVRDGDDGVVVFCHGQFIQMAKWLVSRHGIAIDSDAMREFRRLDLEQPIAHCHVHHLAFHLSSR